MPCPPRTFSGFAGNSDARFKPRLVEEGGSTPSAAPCSLRPRAWAPATIGAHCVWRARSRPAHARVQTPLLAAAPTDAQEAADHEPLDARSRPFPAHFRKPRVKRPAPRPLGTFLFTPTHGDDRASSGWPSLSARWLPLAAGHVMAPGETEERRLDPDVLPRA